MKHEDREKARNASKTHFYEGECIRCNDQSKYIFKEQDLCMGCEQFYLEHEERQTAHLPDPSDKEGMFEHEKKQQGWSDDRDEEIWNEHFR